MKLAIVVIIALIGSMAITANAGKVCNDLTKYWDGKECKDCPTNCTECVAKGTTPSCVKCKDAKFYLKIENDIGSCLPCVENCDLCRGGNAAQCITPSQDYTYNKSALSKCANVKGCLYCAGDNKCAKCNYGYFLDATAGTCTACGEHCAICTSAAKCTKCAFTFALTNDTCKACDTGCLDCPCKNCAPGYTYANNTCVKCAVDNCADCSGNKDQCKTCAFTFGKKDAKCEKCTDTNCLACADDNSKCKICPLKYGLKDDKCVACPTNCDKCDGSGTCSECAAHFYKSSDSKECKACNSNCKETTCTSDGTCSNCDDGYFMKDKQCTACSTGCKTCTDATTCTACMTSQGFLLVDKACKSSVTCGTGKAIAFDGNCTDGTLDNCVYGFNNSASSQTCFQCSKGYYTTDGKACTICQPGCDDCSLNSTGYLSCKNVPQPGLSKASNSNGKKDNIGYLGDNGVGTVNIDNKAEVCLPNWVLTHPILAPANTECNDFDTCQYPVQILGDKWECYKDGKGNNGVKIAVSVFAMAIAAIFAL